MEQNLPIIAKKFWNTIKVLCFMLKKGISKSKLSADLNMIMKRGKIAGKAAIYNLMFHHHSTAGSGRSRDGPQLSHPVPLDEYEFSCSNSPAYRNFHLPFLLNKRKHSNSPPQPPAVDKELLAAALEIFHSAAPSPALPGFGRTPMARQLRITDSPFPVSEIEEDNHVDEAAEKFIMKFYKDLRRQNA